MPSLELRYLSNTLSFLCLEFSLMLISQQNVHGEIKWLKRVKYLWNEVVYFIWLEE